MELEEHIGETILKKPIRAPSVHRLAVGAEQEIATPCDAEGCDSVKLAPAVGVEPASPLPVTRTDPAQNPNKFTAKPLQHRSVGPSQDESQQHNPHTSGHKQHKFTHPGRVPEEYGLSEDLAEIVASWDSLPDALKADILAKVREAVRE